MWGTFFLRLRVVQRQRFIPTCVGNMLGLAGIAVAIYGSSPRVWGTCALFLAFGLACGSSPRVWGTSPPVPLRCIQCRFIPTCVGNMMRTMPTRRGPPVHPHVCGEHTIVVHTLPTMDGSSPRVWGTFGGRWSGVPDSRGSSPRVWGTLKIRVNEFPVSPVHPHVCGEHCCCHRRRSQTCGSSPRVWGTCFTA